jgi:hypothetical protein
MLLAAQDWQLLQEPTWLIDILLSNSAKIPSDNTPNNINLSVEAITIYNTNLA